MFGHMVSAETMRKVIRETPDVDAMIIEEVIARLEDVFPKAETIDALRLGYEMGNMVRFYHDPTGLADLVKISNRLRSLDLLPIIANPIGMDKREVLAELEHVQWSHWTKYMLDNLTEENIARWRRQIATPYNELSEKEKNSDRVWADKVLLLLGD